MSEIIKKPYEISLWEDVLVFLVEYFDSDSVLVDTKEYERSLEDFEEIEGTTTQITQYYKERKICVIGSNTMDSPARAIKPKLVSNVNGSNTLTFSVYSSYYDEEAEDFVQNPYLKLLVNERKVKLRYGALNTDECKWYDLVIKRVEENSDTKTFNYTAKDLFVNELSKTGFSIQLDAKLENNMGTVTTLAQTVMEDSDWEVATDNSSILKQYKEEPLYKITTDMNLIAKDMETQAEISIPRGSVIYGFYGIIANEAPYFQFLYVNNGNYIVDDDHVIINSPNYYVDGISYEEGKPSIAALMQISSEYRGKRLVRQISTKYDSTIDKYVNVYKKNGETYYGYTETEYISPTSVQNFITNSESFTSTTGWELGGVRVNNETIYPILKLQGIPDLRDVADFSDQTQEYTSYLVYAPKREGQILFNSGVADHRAQINTLALNDKFVFRAKFGKAILNAAGRPEAVTGANCPLIFKIGSYTLTDGVYTLGDILFEGTLEASSTSHTEYMSQIVECQKAMAYSDLISTRLGVFITLPFGEHNQYYIQDVQFFRYLTYIKENGDTAMQVPGGELISTTRTKYYYYIPSEDYTSLEDVQYVYIDYEPNSAFEQTYNENTYEKIRSITASESNRFNLIQTLCETFECWAQFTIEHNLQTGAILLGKDKTWYDNNGNVIACPADQKYRQQKYLSFHEYVGKENFAGFKYGINLKSIKRTLDSDGIVSKLVVKNNSNQFSEGGFCTITKAEENITGENFIYDFSYYIQQGLITFSEINNDLYMDVNGYLGYYKKLRELNQNREEWIEEQTGLKKDIANYESSYQVYESSVNKAEEELQDVEQSIIELTGYSHNRLVELYNAAIEKEETDRTEEDNKIIAWWDNDKLLGCIGSYSLLKSTIIRHTQLKDQAYQYLHGNEEQGVPGALDRFEELEELLSNLTTSKRTLALQFYKKYSRFIQEGSWISEDYVDNNLYYLDAESTLHTSSQPKVTYNINVLELSQIEEYENYKFGLGDKTYIEDTEFFGWVWKNGIRTPYHEEIVVTEITVSLDSPEENVIKVQNYKTQFEDLFQRIAATTQQIEYSTGKYDTATSIIEDDGTISIVTLQNSIANNAIVLENAKDQSVVWDETGITTTCLSNPSQVLRIVSGGLFLSTDGGITWNTGITGEGMNANYITTGHLYTNQITILNKNITSFRWDEIGLNAFEFSVDEQGNPFGYNPGKFVRFDQYGIYGINGKLSFDPAEEEDGKKGEEKIWDNASFALTWKGFLLRNKYGSGYVSISSEEDIVVSDGTVQRIKIGNLNSPERPQYGIRIKDSGNNVVMETNDNGTLWLKNRLNVETYVNTNSVGIGKLDSEDQKDIEHGGRIIHASNGVNSQFAVYEDGYLLANGGRFTGTIIATGGQIGNMTIADLENAVGDNRKIEITSRQGTAFKIRNGQGTPESLPLEATAVGFTPSECSPITWEGSADFEEWQNLSDTEGITIEGNFCSITYDFFKNNQAFSTYYIRVSMEDIQGNDYSNWVTILGVQDGEKGESGDEYIIETSVDQILKFYDTTADNLTFSPTDLSFSVFKREEGISSIQSTDKYDIKLSIVGQSDYQNLLGWLNNITLYVGVEGVAVTRNGKDVFSTRNENSYDIHFQDLLNHRYDREEEYENLFFNLKQLLKEDSNIGFQIKVYEHKNTIAPEEEHLLTMRVLPITFGTTDQMAKFTLTANAIQGAVNNGTFTFSENGLVINGTEGLSIYNENKDLVFGYDTLTGQLTIVGNGTFSGSLEAASGSFAGEITAESGTIGGFIIDGNQLKSVDESIILTGRDQDGRGNIIANTIHLGTGAVIDSYIQLNDEEGNYAYICNPTNPPEGVEKGVFIKSDGFSLNTDGCIYLGDIILNGAESVIQGRGFTITPDLADFSNINCSGKITTMVFEKGRIQSVGGAMFFKPSYKVQESSIDDANRLNVILEVEDDSEGQESEVIDNSAFDIEGMLGHFLMFIDREGRIFKNRYFKVISREELLESVNNDEEALELRIEELKEQKLLIIINEQDAAITDIDTIASLIDIGEPGSISIGINSNDGKMADLLYPRGLTIQEFTVPEDYYRGGFVTEMGVPKVYLGDLSTLTIEGHRLSGYGLYSDNVFLRGALTTFYRQGETASSAGINTNSEARTSSGEKIVFWAGAPGTDKDAVENALFQVTEEGSVYAQQGIFNGSIISNSEIRGSNIYTANIYGTGTGDAALTFYDTEKGISFKNLRTGQETLSIGNNGLKIRDTSVLSVTNGVVTYSGHSLKLTDNKDQARFLADGIERVTLDSYGNVRTVNAKIILDETIDFRLGQSDEDTKIKITSDTNQFINEINQFFGTIIYSDRMEYHEIINDNEGYYGYDLYVR